MTTKMSSFQFPSSGKYLPNPEHLPEERSGKEKVSIPFEREIPSKPIQKEERHVAVSVLFQFPSSGKYLPNRSTPRLERFGGRLSFNSLRAGNTFQTPLLQRSLR